MKFFDRIGPPPGYDDDYWSLLVDSYKEGDHVQYQLQRQEYRATHWLETANHDLQPMENDMSIVNDITSILKRKYRAPTDGLDTVLLNVEEVIVTGLESQSRERSLLIQEFVQTGMSLLLNWMLSITPSARFAVLEQCVADVVLTSALDAVLSSRQRRFLLPELADFPMLVGDGVDRLKQLLVRIAAGQENNFAMHAEGATELENAHVAYMNRLEQAPQADKPELMKELDRWAREKAREMWFNVPAVIRIEHLVETAIITHGIAQHLPNIAQLKPLDLESFTQLYYRYRTRGLQLFALSLVERCLKTCLPPQQAPAPATQTKKKKKKK